MRLDDKTSTFQLFPNQRNWDRQKQIIWFVRTKLH